MIFCLNNTFFNLNTCCAFIIVQWSLDTSNNMLLPGLGIKNVFHTLYSLVEVITSYFS